MLPEREITTSVPLTTPNGELNPEAVGWTRSQLHDTSGIGKTHRGRNKRWEYWNVMTPDHILGVTVSDIDYMALHSVWVFDRATGQAIDFTALSPGRGSVTLPGTLGEGPARARTAKLQVDIEEDAAQSLTRLRGSAPRVSFDATAVRPAGHEAMGVVVPWRRRGRVTQFQYTVKDVARPAHGTLTIDGVTHEFAQDAWAVLDHGRGRWPYKVKWNWAAGSGMVDGRRIGVQLGSKWTDGSGSTENALVVDGRVTKISEELHWDYDTNDWMRPWRITGHNADLTFTPFYNKHSATQALVIAARTDQLFGVWTGWMRDEHGEQIRVDGVEGWAEEVINRW